ncbi:hypothetical protein [Bacillus cereus group sp. BfR-BA-01380]|uniref:hypothetical protein n=1 Tax=Bacillus cereus group sp. BfR-BA-01380 TaxID=2920324 RepID=UPI001F5A0861|nr:hypothetical protein [Bacillus cereus group sp. BfR-BA-01380]
MRFNHGKKSTSSVIVRKVDEKLIFIPNKEKCFYLDYIYDPIVVTYQELEKLWSKMRYRLEEDLQHIHELSKEDIIYLWLTLSQFRNQTTDISLFVSKLKERAKILR